MIFQYINVCPVPREMLKTSAYGLGFQHLPRDLANVNAWKTMFDPYNIIGKKNNQTSVSGADWEITTLGSTDNAGNSVNLHFGIICLPSGWDFSVCIGDQW